MIYYFREDILDSLKSAGKKILDYAINSALKALTKYTAIGKMAKMVFDKMKEIGLLDKDVAEELSKLIKKYLTDENLVIIKKEFADSNFKPNEKSFNSYEGIELNKTLKASKKFKEIYDKFVEFEKKIEKTKDKEFSFNYEGSVRNIVDVFLEWAKDGILGKEKSLGYEEKGVEKIAKEVYYELGNDIEEELLENNVELMKFLFNNSNKFKKFYKENKENKKFLLDFVNYFKKYVKEGTSRYGKKKSKGDYLTEFKSIFKDNYFIKKYDIILRILKENFESEIKTNKKLLVFLSNLSKRINNKLLHLKDIDDEETINEFLEIIYSLLKKFKTSMDLNEIVENKQDFFIFVVFLIYKIRAEMKKGEK